MAQNTRQKIYLIITITGVVILPFLLITGFEKFEYIDFNHVFPLIYEQTVGTTVKNIQQFLLILFPTLLLIIISTTLLFDIRIEKGKEETIKETWYWRYFLRYFFGRKKRLWHIILGYYLTIITLTPVLTDEVLNIQSKMHPDITIYQGLILSIIFISPLLLIARILSKLELQILDTNIGIFIMLVYLAGVIFALISGAYIPFEEFQSFLIPNKNFIEGIFMAYGTLTTVVFTISLIDWFIVTKILKKSL